MNLENRYLWAVNNDSQGITGMDGSGNDPEFMFLGDAVADVVELSTVSTEEDI